jgi:hypothetical protein
MDKENQIPSAMTPIRQIRSIEGFKILSDDIYAKLESILERIKTLEEKLN